MRLREAGEYPGDVVGVGGGRCGEWVERDGRPGVELNGVGRDPYATE